MNLPSDYDPILNVIQDDLKRWTQFRSSVTVQLSPSFESSCSFVKQACIFLSKKHDYIGRAY